MPEVGRGAVDRGVGGKVVIVTGGSAPGDGISNGRAAAIVLARAGARVVVCGRRPENLDRTVAMIDQEGGVAAAVVGDVREEADCRRIVDATLERFGRLDGLDNNVGDAQSTRGNLVDTGIGTLRQTLRDCLDSQVLMSICAIPAMVESAGGGAIVNLSSASALRPQGATAYSTAKGASIALSRAMAIDHGRQGVRVNCLVVGPVFSARIAAKGLDEVKRRQRAAASPLGIEGSPWDVANAVLFLLSDHARYITGQALVVDGGVSIVGPDR